MARKPNFIIIQTDDQGWDDLACHGNPWLETPVLDKLASESLRFSNFYVAPVCAPTRASLLTGRHSLRTGVSHVHGGRDFVHLDEIMLGEVLQKAGYSTGVWGKWHSGKTNGYFPWERGFNEAFMAGLYQHRDNHGFFNGKEVHFDGKWTVDVITDYAVDFLERKKDSPFLAYLSYLTVHSPIDAPAEITQKYIDKGLSENLSAVYAMIDQFDSSLERLFAKIDQLGLRENTYVLFMSDNGPAILENFLTEEDRRKRYVSRYKGHKGNMWENGIKSPLFIRLPEKSEEKFIERVVDITDIFPTICELAGAKLENNHPELDGRSFTPYLQGNTESLPPRELFIYANPGWPPSAEIPYSVEGRDNEYAPVAPEDKSKLPPAEQLITIRNEEYKLLQNAWHYPECPQAEDNLVLVHMTEDPREDHNIIRKVPEKAEEMKHTLHQWFQGILGCPHSYHSPIFQIGYPNGWNFIPAYAPMRVHDGLLNTVHYLKNWNSSGKWAEYDVNVKKAGKYEVVIYYDKQREDQARLCFGSSYSKVGADIIQDLSSSLGIIELKEGRQELKLEIPSSNPGIKGKGLERINMILLRDPEVTEHIEW